MAERGATGGLAAAIREAALLEGDFLLRSGRRSSYYLDKYRFSTRPDLLAPARRALAAAVSEHEPDAVRIAAPELGAVPLAAAASLALGLPFVIVRGAAKEYGTANRLEGVFEPGERVCLVEDVVTAGGAALEAVEALREAGLARLHRRLRRRPRGGRRRRARAVARAAPAALRRLRDPCRCPEAAWLSDKVRWRC